MSVSVPVCQAHAEASTAVKKYLFKAVVLLFLLSGITQLCQGCWILAKAEVAQVLLETAWARTLKGEKEVKPWPWADTWPVSRLDVPRLGISRFVLAGASGSSLAFGPGHLFGTPAAGDQGNSVIAGHRDTHFAFLQELEEGDVLEIENAQGQRIRFIIHSSRVVQADAVDALTQGDETRLTLVTCYPFGDLAPGGNLRYLLVADRM